MDDSIQEFLAETAENLGALDADLIRLQQNPNDPDLMERILRFAHTVKGTSGFLGLPRLEKMAQHIKNVIGRYRDGSLTPSPSSVPIILAALEQVRLVAADVADDGTEPEGDDSPLIRRLEALCAGTEPLPEEKPAAVGDDSVCMPVTIDSFISLPSEPVEKHGAELPLAVENPVVQSGGVVAPVTVESFILSSPELVEKPAATSVPEEKSSDSQGVIAPVTIDSFVLAPLELVEKPSAVLAPGEESVITQEAVAPVTVESFILSASELVEKPAAALVPEEGVAGIQETVAPVTVESFVLSSAELVEKPAAAPSSQYPAVPALPELPLAFIGEDAIHVGAEVLQKLTGAVSELVESRKQVMQILRAQPENPLTAPLERLDRAVSSVWKDVGQTRLQPIGRAWSKLPHLVHDISAELEKIINLELRGCDTPVDCQLLEPLRDLLTAMIRNVAAQGIEMPDERLDAGKPEVGTIVLNAFHESGRVIIELSDNGAGLSDAAAAVGAEPGYANIKKLCGTISTKSVTGKGSTVTIKIPVEETLTPVVVVETAAGRYIIPQVSVRELVHISDQEPLEDLQGTPALRHRNRLLPLIPLDQVLQMEGVRSSAGPGQSRHVVVVQAAAGAFGLVVDRVLGMEEVVLQPLSPVLKNIPFFSGNAILSDDRVVMALDPDSIAEAAGTLAGAEEEQPAEIGVLRSEDERKTPLLLFRAGAGGLRAVPLLLVNRLEEFDVRKIEGPEQQKTVSYHGQFMPLVPFSNSMPLRTNGTQPVLVFADRARAVGLMVDEVVGIVEGRVEVHLAGEDNKGLLGRTVINGETVEVADVSRYLSGAQSDGLNRPGQAGLGLTGAPKKILLVDDSPAFRNMLLPLLSMAGYYVISATSATEALLLCAAGEKFDVIVSAIEMPGMSGYDFARRAKAGDSPWKDVPLVALSAQATKRDLELGRAAGFMDTVAKFDRGALLRSIAQMGAA